MTKTNPFSVFYVAAAAHLFLRQYESAAAVPGGVQYGGELGGGHLPAGHPQLHPGELGVGVQAAQHNTAGDPPLPDLRCSA